MSQIAKKVCPWMTFPPGLAPRPHESSAKLRHERCVKPAAVSVYLPQVGLSLLLLIEVLGLMVSFDTQGLHGLGTVWAQLIDWAPQYFRLAASVMVAVLALAAAQRPAEFRRFVTTKPAGSRIPAFGLHVCSLALFAFVTSTIVATGASYQARPAFWTMAWFLTGFATLAAWLLALFPLRAWLDAISVGRRSIGWGIAIGGAVWTCGFLTAGFWIPIARYTFGFVAWMLGLLYPRVINNPARLVVGTPAFKVTISPQCSGYEGVGLILVFLSVYLWLYRRELRFPAALVLLPIGAVLIWLANAVRIVALIAIGTAGWKAVAAGGFHSQAGWIAFNAIALGFVALTNHFGYFRKPSESVAVATDTSHGQESDATAAYLGPFLVISATAMLTGAFSAGFDWLYPVRVVAAGAVLWACRKHYASLRWSYSWWSFTIGLVTFLLWLALIPEASSRNAGWPAALQAVPLEWAALWLFVRVVGYVVTAPLAEELAFRGFLTRRIVRPDFEKLPVGIFSWSSFVISSVVFGAFHGSLWLPGTIAGMSFALALYRRGIFGEAVWAHATTNGLIALYACATGRWWVWA